ncbi:hypothetical protein Zmor_015002 [Zophobas morio]|uniref:HTH CENPB-type domain-containing protein n=1 Tax=Zophobas morio TaxID=2755281 RepID=A0AA38IJ61_9CUCU|nr:hypothetical protein Zmor_015002 [Zophobas morio]
MGPYRRKSSRQSWSEQNMKEAILAVRGKKMGWLRASKIYSVPSTTLRRQAKIADGWRKGYLGGRKSTFDKNLEDEIVAHVKNLETRLFGMSTNDIRKLAYQVAEAKGLSHKFSAAKEMAGWDWYKGFMQRNLSLSLRTPEATSAARARAFNKPQITKYFKSLLETLEKYDFQPNQIWNVDESGLSTVPSKNAKIIATKGRKQVGILSSAERGQHLTVVCCMNPLGIYIPPAFIFPRKNMKQELLDHAPTGSTGFTQEKGWMTGDIFLKWLKHFVKYAKPTEEEQILLLVDGHGSHKDLNVLNYAKHHGIIMFCFPPHCTHRVQPLDVSFYGPLTSFYNQELISWLRNHPGRVITHYQVAEIFKTAYNKSATIENAEKGFAATGIYPFNSEVFPDWMFTPSEVTNVDLSDNETSSQGTENAEQIRPSTSATSQLSETLEITKSPNKDISIEDISTLPIAELAKNKKKRRKGKQGVLNDTPNLEEAKKVESEKKNKQKNSQKTAVRRVTKNLYFGESDDERLETDDEDDPACIFCNELYTVSKSGEMWIQCQKSRK